MLVDVDASRWSCPAVKCHFILRHHFSFCPTPREILLAIRPPLNVFGWIIMKYNNLNNSLKFFPMVGSCIILFFRIHHVNITFSYCSIFMKYNLKLKLKTKIITIIIYRVKCNILFSDMSSQLSNRDMGPTADNRTRIKSAVVWQKASRCRLIKSILLPKNEWKL